MQSGLGTMYQLRYNKNVLQRHCSAHTRDLVCSYLADTSPTVQREYHTPPHWRGSFRLEDGVALCQDVARMGRASWVIIQDEISWLARLGDWNQSREG
ncbi:hypothetical protein N7471_011583 [Penicillium samsonianum]|uniref:uncharacterized protein n=1 Tax=Penicillium samsonianum TaxID=1882272 RepID=UPI0025474D46|nr:uncharacterized protein N7471_011583 [Penicillium samsonianum]KAJ6124266.1 hypothetical protein N7471_011583 [Penicillium samsonianum]